MFTKRRLLGMLDFSSQLLLMLQRRRWRLLLLFAAADGATRARELCDEGEGRTMSCDRRGASRVTRAEARSRERDDLRVTVTGCSGW